MEGKKFDQEKPDMSLLSSVAMHKIAAVMSFGKKKYTAHNWRGGIVYSRLLAAALRHVFSYLGGETNDPESGLSHLAHAACCIMMLLEFETTRPDLDDRYKSNQRSTKENSEAAKVADKIVNAPEQGMSVKVIDTKQYIPKEQS